MIQQLSQALKIFVNDIRLLVSNILTKPGDNYFVMILEMVMRIMLFLKYGLIHTSLELFKFFLLNLPKKQKWRTRESWTNYVLLALKLEPMPDKHDLHNLILRLLQI